MMMDEEDLSFLRDRWSFLRYGLDYCKNCKKVYPAGTGHSCPKEQSDPGIENYPARNEEMVLAAEIGASIGE